MTGSALPWWSICVISLSLSKLWVLARSQSGAVRVKVNHLEPKSATEKNDGLGSAEPRLYSPCMSGPGIPSHLKINEAIWV